MTQRSGTSPQSPVRPSPVPHPPRLLPLARPDAIFQRLGRSSVSSRPPSSPSLSSSSSPPHLHSSPAFSPVLRVLATFLPERHAHSYKPTACDCSLTCSLSRLLSKPAPAALTRRRCIFVHPCPSAQRQNQPATRTSAAPHHAPSRSVTSRPSFARSVLLLSRWPSQSNHVDGLLPYQLRPPSKRSAAPPASRSTSSTKIPKSHSESKSG